MQRRDLLCAAAAAAALSGCGDTSRLPTLPDSLRGQPVFSDLPEDSRIVLDSHSDEVLARIARQALEREMAFVRSGGREDLGSADFLAISGGGENGAFGAGLLTAWSGMGTRPEFKAVTGISTGALMAPSAFLGPAYDKDLEDFYTRTSEADIMTSRGLATALFSDSLYNPQPLLRTIRGYMTDAVLEAIAREYNVKGRLLFVATTNLDVPVGVLWNIGAIAASASPRKTELIARVLLASASIPGAFPPVMIDIEVDGQHFQEMHVDGGTVAQVVLYPPSFGGGDVGQILQAADPAMVRLLRQRRRRLFVIRNSRPGPDPSTVGRSTLEIVERAVSTLINTQGIGDLYQLYLLSQRDGIDFNAAYIPQSFSDRLDRPFDTAYMRKLYALGSQEMLESKAWHKTPPGYDPTPFHSILQSALRR